MEGGSGFLDAAAADLAGVVVEPPGPVVGAEQVKLLVHGFKNDRRVRQQRQAVPQPKHIGNQG
jgi:hypothetical protein